MKIQKIDEFINESSLTAERTVEDIIRLDSISLKCTWTGEHWYYYNKEEKGTWEDFKKLDKNKNADFEMEFGFDFSVVDGEDKEEVRGDAMVTMQLNLHYSNMAEDDYDLDLKYCHDMDDLVELLSDYNISREELVELIKDAWDEKMIEDDLFNEMEDRIGLDKSFDLTTDIEDRIVTEFIKGCINEK